MYTYLVCDLLTVHSMNSSSQEWHRMGVYCSLAIPRKGDLISLQADDNEQSEHGIYEVLHFCHNACETASEEPASAKTKPSISQIFNKKIAGTIYVVPKPSGWLSTLCNEFVDDQIINAKPPELQKRVHPPKR